MNGILYKSQFQSVINSKSYKHFPSWKGLQEKKKNIIRWIWIDAILLSILTTGMITEVWEKFEQNWFATVFTWLFLSAAAMLLYVISTYHTIYLKFRQTEHEVRKLIFQDLLLQLRREK
ncbi:MAG: hypothetical protein ACXWCZ_14695 [Flavisolibacter sp.]